MYRPIRFWQTAAAGVAVLLVASACGGNDQTAQPKAEPSSQSVRTPTHCPYWHDSPLMQASPSLHAAPFDRGS